MLITGGSRGLGHAMALGFGECGAKLAIASRKIDSCEATVAELRALGSDGSAHAAHVGKWADCDRLVEEVYARWGRIDVLVNNAGLSPVVPSSLETSEDLFDKVIGVNLKGPFRLTSLIGPRMVAGDGGAVINISSTSSIRPAPDTAPYSAAKAGLNILTVAFAQEYGPKVRVNAIMAGPFHTDISKSWSRTEGFTKAARAEFPLAARGRPARDRRRGALSRERRFELHHRIDNHDRWRLVVPQGGAYCRRGLRDRARRMPLDRP